MNSMHFGLVSESDPSASWIPEWVLAWTSEHPDFLRYALLSSVIVFVGSLVALPFLVSAIPANYFATAKSPLSGATLRHPVIRLLLLGLKNLVGAVFLGAGLVMLVTPGQGVMCILIGLSFLNFPGKRRLELWIVRKPKVLSALNWMRSKTGKPALLVYKSESDSRATE